MRYSFEETAVILRHPLLWQHRLVPGLMNRLWPLGSRLASADRQFLIPNTHIVAVVGSQGKTTTTHTVAAAIGYQLSGAYRRSFGNAYYSVGLRILGIRPSTPRAVIEVGIKGPGQMAPIAQMLRPDVAVVTSIASDHHLQFHTLNATREEKAEMVRALPPSGLAVLNGDDPNVRWMAGQTRARVVFFGFQMDNHIRADDITLDWPNGTRFRLHAHGESRNVTTRLVGRHLVYPILAAIAVALDEGLALDPVVRALSFLPPTPGRLQPVLLEDGTILLRDDCKPDVESLEAALDLFSEVPAARRGLVLVNMLDVPEPAESIYLRLGQRIADIASYAIFHGDTPTTQGYLREAGRSGLPPERTRFVTGSFKNTVNAIRGLMEPGDVVLFKGRGSQHVERIVLALQGGNVVCDVLACGMGLQCDLCPRLERGWPNRSG